VGAGPDKNPARVRYNVAAKTGVSMGRADIREHRPTEAAHVFSGNPPVPAAMTSDGVQAAAGTKNEN
jgi:hypothetical protein